MNHLGRLLWMLLPLGLVGCTASKEDELRAWMAQERMQNTPRVVPISPPKQFVPQPYAVVQTAEPFSSQKALQVQDASRARSNDALLGPELARRKEPLESFALETTALVGSISRAGQPVALVRVGGLLYQVRLGNHLGLNYGRVMKITETELTLREIVQDAAGDWTERLTTLQLQEKSP